MDTLNKIMKISIIGITPNIDENKEKLKNMKKYGIKLNIFSSQKKKKEEKTQKSMMKNV